jgi:flagellin-like hook-associated protein FlgL
VELKLNEMNQLACQQESDSISQKEKDKLNEEWQRRGREFKNFLNNHKDNMDEETIF